MTPRERDLIIRTVIGEAAQESPEGQRAVAHVIMNRVRGSGRGVSDVVFAPNQFEPWGNQATRGRLLSYTQADPTYQRVAQVLEPVFSGQSQDPTGGATHFYSPTAQASLGRQPPSWDDGSGADIGRHRFFRHGYNGSGVGNRHGMAGAQPVAAPAQGGVWDQAGSVLGDLGKVAWDVEGESLPAYEAPAAAPAAASTTPPTVQPAAVQAAEKPVLDGIQWDEPAAPAAPALTPDALRSAGQQRAPGVQPEPVIAPQIVAGPALGAPNLDETFANFQGGLPTQGDAVAQQRSIPEITVRPRDSVTRRQQAQLRTEQELAASGRVVGNATAAAQGLLRGVNPLMDDTNAFFGTITGQGEGNSFGERFLDNLRVQRGVNAAFDAQHPVASFGGQLTGGLALPVGKLGQAANGLTRFGRGAGVGAGYGAAFGFGQGEDIQDRLRRAATGAAVGAAVGGPLNAAIGARMPQAPVPNARPTSAQVVEAAERQGINVPRAVASDSMIAQQLGQRMQATPLGNPIARATQNMTQQMGVKLDDTAAAMSAGGAVPGRDAAGAAARTSIDDTVRNEMPQRANQLYSRVEQMMPAGQTYALANTAQAAQDLAARAQAAGLGESAAVRTVQDALARPGGLTYQGLRDLRTRINEMTNFGATPSGMSNAELKQIGAAVTRDIDAAVSSAGPAAQRAYNQANQWYSAWAQRRDTLGRILNTQSDEGVVNQIVNAASSRNSADIWKLSTARKAMGNDEWRDIAAQVVSRLGRDGEGNFSPARFVTDYGKLSERGKDILFRATGDRAHAQALDDIATISSRWRETQRFGNPSGTAAAAITGAGAFGGLAYLTGDPVTAATSILGAAAISRALASAPTASSMARWSRAYQTAVRTPTAASLTGLQIASRNFASTLGEKAGVSVDPVKLMEPVTRSLYAPRRGAADDDQADPPRVIEQRAQ